MAQSHAISAAAVRQTHTVSQWGKKKVKITAEIKKTYWVIGIKICPVLCRLGKVPANCWVTRSNWRACGVKLMQINVWGVFAHKSASLHVCKTWVECCPVHVSGQMRSVQQELKVTCSFHTYLSELKEYQSYALFHWPKRERMFYQACIQITKSPQSIQSRDSVHYRLII